MRKRTDYHRHYKRRQRAMQKLGIQIVNPAEKESLVMDSRKVAEMVNKRHDHLMRDIRGYVQVLEVNPDLGALNFFIPSTYLDSQGKTRSSFLLTKQGCEMVGNKMTGEKGILFTATYVSQFNEMEKVLEQNELPKKITNSARIVKDLEFHLTAVKLSAEILEADEDTLIKMLEAVYEQFGIPTEYLLEFGS